MQSMSWAGPDAGPEQTEELISNTKCVGAPVATYYPDYASSRAGPGSKRVSFAPLLGVLFGHQPGKRPGKRLGLLRMIDNRSSPSGFAVQTRLCRPTPGPRPTTGPDATSPHQFAPPPNKACSSGGKLSWTPFERYKVPEGRMRGRVVNGADPRIPSPGQQLDVPPPPAPPPRRCRLCWAKWVARERGDARPTAKTFACHRRNDHPTTPRPHRNPLRPHPQ
jgi:hypothetical protein